MEKNKKKFPCIYDLLPKEISANKKLLSYTFNSNPNCFDLHKTHKFKKKLNILKFSLKINSGYLTTTNIY